MAHHHTIAHRQRDSQDRILRRVRNAYGHLALPNDDDVELFGNCLVTVKEELDGVQERVATIERNIRPLRSLSPQESDNGPAISDSNKLDIIIDSIEDLSKRFKQAQGREDDILRKIEHLEDIAAEWETDKVDRAGSANADLDEVDIRLTTEIADLQKTQEAAELESTEKLKTMFKEFRTEIQEDLQNILAARQRNSMVNRLYEMVTPVAARNLDAKGRATFKIANSPPRSVKYYWNMHDLDNRKKLVAEHKFYNINYKHWACRLEGNSDSDDDELAGSDPITIEEAVGRYPDRAVMALFNVLGLEYSRFRDQTLRDQSRREQHTTHEKRFREESLTGRSIRKKRNSLGSTTEPLTVSTCSTQSVE